MLAINREAEGGGKHIDRLAKVLIAKAAEGDVAALREIGDRLDGKPAQSLGIGQAEELDPIKVQATIRPQINRDEWLKHHGEG